VRLLGASTAPDGGELPAGVPPSPPMAIPFGEGMTRPKLISGKQPVYSNQARTACIEGLMLARCVVTTEGILKNCRIIKSLPYMEQSVIDALATQRFTPVIFEGKPINGWYVIPFKFKLR
jgi:protein TonB